MLLELWPRLTRCFNAKDYIARYIAFHLLPFIRTSRRRFQRQDREPLEHSHVTSYSTATLTFYPALFSKSKGSYVALVEIVCEVHVKIDESLGGGRLVDLVVVSRSKEWREREGNREMAIRTSINPCTVDRGEQNRSREACFCTISPVSFSLTSHIIPVSGNHLVFSSKISLRKLSYFLFFLFLAEIGFVRRRNGTETECFGFLLVNIRRVSSLNLNRDFLIGEFTNGNLVWI